MAVGDIGSIIEAQKIDNALDYIARAPLNLGDDVTEYWAVGGPHFSTWRVNPADGDVTVINGGTGNMASGYTDWSELYDGPLFHIAGTVYGCVFHTDASGYRTMRLCTANISDAGVEGANIAVGTLEAFADKWDHGSQLSHVFHIAGNIYAFAYCYSDNSPVYYQHIAVRTFSVSDDGVTISLVDTDIYSWANFNHVNVDFQHVSGNVYVAIGKKRNVGGVVAVSYNIADDGTITQLDTLTVDTGYSNSDHDIRICKIAEGVFGAAYYLTSPSTVGRIRTFALADNGTFGSVIDTDDAIIGAYTDVHDFQDIGDQVFLITCGNYAYTVAIAADGTIGSLVDSLNTGEALYTLKYINSANYFTGCYLHIGAETFAFSVDIEQDIPPELTDRIYVWLGDKDDPLQVELTDPDYSMVLSVRTEIGWSEELQQAQAGIAEVVCDNHNGDFSPENASGQYYGDLVLGKYVSIFEVYNGTRYDHFFGRIEKITPHVEHDNQLAYIQVIDGMNDFNGLDINTVMRTDTDTGELAEDVLDAADWPAGDRDIDTGVDTLQVGWFHKTSALAALQTLEKVEMGHFYIDPTGIAVFENRHRRLSGDGLVSQATFDETMVELAYEWSKRLVYNTVTVRGRRYYVGGVALVSGYDMAELDDSLVWSAHAGDSGAPMVTKNGTLTLWAEFGSPLQSYTTLVKGTHWNANSLADKTGDDLSDNITLTETQYGQSIKLEFENTDEVDAYLVVPDSPPLGAPDDRTVLVYGVLFNEEVMAITAEDTDSQNTYGKRGMDIDTPFKSNPNDVEAHATFLVGKYKDAVPRAVSCKLVARTAWPDDTIRVQCLTRHISDRITIVSSKMGVDQDYYINKVIQEYIFQEAGIQHETTWIIERCLGTAEGVFWLLGVTDFGELGEATRLGI